MKGNANVLIWGEGINSNYLDWKAMYNEIALNKAKNKKEIRSQSTIDEGAAAKIEKNAI